MAAGHWLGTTGVGRHGLMAVSAISVYDRQCWPSVSDGRPYRSVGCFVHELMRVGFVVLLGTL